SWAPSARRSRSARGSTRSAWPTDVPTEPPDAGDAGQGHRRPQEDDPALETERAHHDDAPFRSRLATRLLGLHFQLGDPGLLLLGPAAAVLAGVVRQELLVEVHLPRGVEVLDVRLVAGEVPLLPDLLVVVLEHDVVGVVDAVPPLVHGGDGVRRLAGL